LARRRSRRYHSGWTPWQVAAMALVALPTGLFSSGTHAVEMFVSDSVMPVVIICRIAIAYSMGQIIKSVCICQSVCVRLRALSQSHLLIDFHQNWHRRKNLKSKTSSLGSTSRHPFPHFAPRTTILGQKVLKIRANIK